MGNLPCTPEMIQLKEDILDQAEKLPAELREYVGEQEHHRARIFLMLVEEKLIHFLYGSSGKRVNSAVDTPEQVEVALRFFPQIMERENWGIQPPVFRQLWSSSTVAFVPVFVKLGLELGYIFTEEEKGGLFFLHWNILKFLVNDEWMTRCSYEKNPEFAEKKLLPVLKELRTMGILEDRDIEEQALIEEISMRSYFPKETLCCLLEWNPRAFREACCKGPHSVYKNWIDTGQKDSIQQIFALGLGYFPNQQAFFFRADEDSGETPYEQACAAFGVRFVIDMMQDGWIQRASPKNLDSSLSDALVEAASDPEIHLDGVYFLLRFHPMVAASLR